MKKAASMALVCCLTMLLPGCGCAPAVKQEAFAEVQKADLQQSLQKLEDALKEKSMVAEASVAGKFMMLSMEAKTSFSYDPVTQTDYADSSISILVAGQSGQSYREISCCERGQDTDWVQQVSSTGIKGSTEKKDSALRFVRTLAIDPLYAFSKARDLTAYQEDGFLCLKGTVRLSDLQDTDKIMASVRSLIFEEVSIDASQVEFEMEARLDTDGRPTVQLSMIPSDIVFAKDQSLSAVLDSFSIDITYQQIGLPLTIRAGDIFPEAS